MSQKQCAPRITGIPKARTFFNLIERPNTGKYSLRGIFGCEFAVHSIAAANN
jgi:hypothetical protein